MGFQESFQRTITAGDRAFGVTVTLSQGDRVTDSFTAQVEGREYSFLDAEGFLTKVQSRDFMFAKTDAVVGVDSIEPRAGDRFTLTENGEEKYFEALPIGDMPAVEEMDGGYRWRVHTKRVGR